MFDDHRSDFMPPAYQIAQQLFKKGHELQSQGLFDDAISSFKKAITLNPNFPAPYFSLGALLQQRGYVEDAIVLYQKVLDLSPGHSDTYNILGSAFQAKGQIEMAMESYQKAIEFNPDSYMAHNNLGSALKLMGNIDQAIEQYQIALRLNPDFPEALNNLGNAFRDTNKIDMAIDSYRKSILLKPEFADPHLNLAYAFLLSGRFEEGWKEYEWRWKIKEPLHKLYQPLWNGEDRAGQTILLYAEQGFGDTIHFVRYASMVAEKGLKVIAGCQRELKSLIGSVKGISQVIAFGEVSPRFDIRCPLLSLPGIFKTSMANIPSEVPYIFPGEEIVRHWGGILSGHREELNIGVTWAGSPGHVNDRNRSLPLEMLMPLTSLNGITFYSLQKELADPNDIELMKKMNIRDYTEDIRDFSDTAGIIMNLDLVISVDTAVVHLAGALGRTVWTLLPFSPDWRWLLNREDSPWYPTMRLFRQPSPGNWTTLIDDIRQEIIKIMNARGI